MTIWGYQKLGKRILDVSVATFALIVLSPVLLVVALVTLVAHGRPVLFRQRRPGRNGEPFTIYKFRSMRNSADADGRPLPDEKRLTRVGAWLRATSLDELPELLNVVRGDMSLVGPRPMLMHYLPLYTPEEYRRHEVKPGITGLAQVRGRNGISYTEKFAYDVEYVDKLSFALDLRILAATAREVILRRGINPDGYTTTAEYWGPPPQDAGES